MVVMIMSALMAKEISERVDIVVFPEATVKAPALKDAYPHALQTFRKNKCECKPNSLCARIANAREMPCQYASSRTETERQKGSSIQRRLRAPLLDMRPDGIGLHGLFEESSSGSSLWFETQN